MLLKRGKKVEESQSFEWPGKKRGSGEEAAHPSARPRDQNPAIDLCSGRRDSPLVSEGILHGSHHLGQELLALLDVAPLGRKMKLSHVCLFFGFVRTCFCARVAGKREYDVKVSTFLEKKKKRFLRWRVGQKRARVQGTRGSSKTARAGALAIPRCIPFSTHPTPCCLSLGRLPSGARARVRFLKQPRTYAEPRQQRGDGGQSVPDRPQHAGGPILGPISTGFSTTDG